MAYRPTLTTLAYVVRERHGRREVLLCHRNARPHDAQLGKYNGVGGKLERDEDPVTGMLREVREETGLDVRTWELRGTVNWPGFSGPDAHDFGFVFLVTEFDGEPPAANEEGELGWHGLDALDGLPMWEGDRYFLPLVFDADPRQFHAVIGYADGHPTGCRIVR